MILLTLKKIWEFFLSEISGLIVGIVIGVIISFITSGIISPRIEKWQFRKEYRKADWKILKNGIKRHNMIGIGPLNRLGGTDHIPHYNHYYIDIQYPSSFSPPRIIVQKSELNLVCNLDFSPSFFRLELPEFSKTISLSSTRSFIFGLQKIGRFNFGKNQEDRYRIHLGTTVNNGRKEKLLSYFRNLPDVKIILNPPSY